MSVENHSSEMEEDFSEALALLHSNEEDSAEKLRKMLDALLESKYGATKTLSFRMPKEFMQKERMRWRTYSKNSVRLVAEKKKQQQLLLQQQQQQQQQNEQQQRQKEADDSNDEVIAVKENPVNVINIDYEQGEGEGDEKIEVPRISIPDEGITDGALCKICNGAKLGPLILLECQECQEIYHPLCHNPPVIDIDVYDPRLVWRCGKCVQASPRSYETLHEDPKPDSGGRKTLNKFGGGRAIEVEGKRRGVKVNERERSTKRRH